MPNIGKIAQIIGPVVDVSFADDAHLPKINISSNYIFAEEDKYFVYQNNYNQFVNYYNETFQHGGVSLEEMIIPVVTYTPR